MLQNVSIKTVSDTDNAPKLQTKSLSTMQSVFFFIKKPVHAFANNIFSDVYQVCESERERDKERETGKNSRAGEGNNY